MVKIDCECHLNLYLPSDNLLTQEEWAFQIAFNGGGGAFYHRVCSPPLSAGTYWRVSWLPVTREMVWWGSSATWCANTLKLLSATRRCGGSSNQARHPLPPQAAPLLHPLFRQTFVSLLLLAGVGSPKQRRFSPWKPYWITPPTLGTSPCHWRPA